MKLFPPEGSAEGCASGECIPAQVEPVLAPDLAEEEPELPAPSHISTDEEKWKKAVDAVRDASPRHGKSLTYARFLGFSPEGVKVAFPPDAAFHRSQILGMSRALVEGELKKSLGRSIRLIEDTDAGALARAPQSIAEVEATDRNSRERSIDEKVRNHPALRNVLRHLGGTIEHVAYLEPPKKVQSGAVTLDESDAAPPVD